MSKIIWGTMVVVGIGVVSLVLAGGAEHASPKPPIALAVTTAPGTGASPRASSQDAGMSAVAVAPASRPANAKPLTSRPSNASKANNVMAALQQAADARKHLFVFVYEQDDEQTRAGRKTFDTAVARHGDAVQWIAINRTASSETEFIEKYGLKAAPMPLALSFAPNGAIIGGFLGARLTEQQLMDALATPAMQTCLKALQERKLVFLCAQNGKTQSNDTAMRGVNEFKADERFAQATEIIKVDPSEAAEKKFMTQLQINPKVEQATTVFLAPPGSIVAKLAGATNKEALVTALQKASSGCGAGGCGPKGCAPTK